MKYFRDMLLLQVLVFGQILDVPGTVYVDNCYPYQCNLQGICANLSGNSYMCDCFTYYDGDNCESTLSSCDFVDCGDAGTCLYNDAIPVCYCEYGWEREDLEVLTSACTRQAVGISLCDNYDCGGKGECYLFEGEALCDCGPGWGGDTCSWKIQDISNMFLLEMAALLSDNYPQQAKDIAFDCSYLWPLVWNESPTAKAIGEWDQSLCAPCTCLSAIREVAADNSWDTLYQWRLDSKYVLNIEDLLELHCPYKSTDDAVVEFASSLSSFSKDCAVMLNDVARLPLYLRNEMTCSCLNSVVDYVDDAKNFLKHPLDITKPWSSAYMNYRACTSNEGVCDFREMYAQVMQESANMPEVVDACAPAVLAMAKSLNDSEYEDLMCTCMMKVSKYCSKCGVDWFSCRASSWDWVGVGDRFRQLCFNAEKVYREFAWTMNRYAMELISVDPMGASSCSSAMRTSLARAQVPLGIDDKINQTLCACLTSLASNGFDSAWDDIMAVVPTGFSMVKSQCTSNDTDSEFLKSLSAQVLTFEDTKQINIMVILAALLVFNLIWLAKNLGKTRGYSKLEERNNFQNIDGRVSYRTTDNK